MKRIGSSILTDEEERGRAKWMALIPRGVALSSAGRLGGLMHFLYSFNGHS